MLSLIVCFSIFGHSGRTDKNGGHYNHKTGEYHYHNKGGGGFIWVVIVGGVIFLFLRDNDSKK